MGYYFDERMSAAFLHGSAPEAIIRLMASRYMGDNPVSPFVWRAWNETGIQADEKARYHFDFSRRFPGAENGMIAYACGDLFCGAEKRSRFVVTCSSPLSVWLNGEKIFQSNGSQERNESPCEVTVSLKKGYNRFLLRSECTTIGFGCTLQNAMPQWEPCNYILPFAERKGAAGFLYTAPMAAECTPGDSVWRETEEATGIQWLPECVTPPVNEEGSFYGWVDWNSTRVIRGTELPGETVWIDGSAPKKEAVYAPTRHELLFYGTLSSIREAAAGLPGTLSQAVHLAGSDAPMLILGPCAHCAPDPAELLKPGVLYEDTSWRPDAAGLRLRPYVEVPLFGRWTYPLGVTLYGILSAGRLLNEPAYTEYVKSHVRQVTDIQAYALWDKKNWGFPGVNQQLCWLDALDDCGSFGSLMLECDPRGEVPSIRAIAERIGTYMLTEQPRTENGAFCRRDDTIWADDMYMSGPFLCRYAQMMGKTEALDDYASQQLKYRQLLFMPDKKIMAHMMCLRHGKNNGIPWSRGNGWVIFSLSELLMRMEPSHPLRADLLRHFNELTEGYLALQDENGLWHQILDERETYPESSATAMFICAFCRGVRNGWYSHDLAARAKIAAGKAWKGLTEQVIDRGGNLYGVCQGSGFSFSRAYYRTLMWTYNDTHGIGIVMLAGVEYLKTLENA